MSILGNCNIYLAVALERAVGAAWSTIAACEHRRFLRAPRLVTARTAFAAEAKNTFPSFNKTHTLLTETAASCLKAKGLREPLEWITQDQGV